MLALNPDSGELFFSPVILFLDRDPQERRQFYVLRTESGKSVTLTPTHLIFASQSDAEDDAFSAVFASDVREGDSVLVSTSTGTAVEDRVVAVEVTAATGVFAPLTAAGNLVVDGVVASSYAVIESQSVAHAVFAPWRWRAGLFGATDDDNRVETGVHWYADWLFSVARYVMPGKLRNLP